MTIKIEVSERLCTGQGRCYVVSPEVYSPDDEGFCAQRGTVIDVAEGFEDKARLGMDACPEGAITLVED